MKPGGGVRVQGLEAAVEGLRARLAGLGPERGPEGRVRRRPRQEPPDQRAVVETGPAHQDRPPPPAPRGRDRLGGLAGEAGGVVAARRARRRPRGGGGPRGAPRAWAWRCRCPSGGRPGGSRRSRPRSASARRARPPGASCRRPSGRGSRGAGRAARRHRRRDTARHQVRRSSRLISPSGIRETIGRPCGQ